MDEEKKSAGQVAFEAYNAQGPNPWKTHDGRPVPGWLELGDQVRGKWEAAAEAVVPDWVDIAFRMEAIGLQRRGAEAEERIAAALEAIAGKYSPGPAPQPAWLKEPEVDRG